MRVLPNSHFGMNDFYCMRVSAGQDSCVMTHRAQLSGGSVCHVLAGTASSRLQCSLLCSRMDSWESFRPQFGCNFLGEFCFLTTGFFSINWVVVRGMVLSSARFTLRATASLVLRGECNFLSGLCDCFISS